MKSFITKDIHIVLPKAAMTAIFDDCDGFDHDETGGRVIGRFKENNGQLTLQVTGVIEAGPQAERSRVSFFQDGEYQEKIFRKIERQHPEIEHLGNWHTHHVNGLQTLSSGDLTTYTRIVNHPSQNTPFFYAMLVVAKHTTNDPLKRYTLKHYIFRPNDDRVYEVPHDAVEIVNTPLVWPSKSETPFKRQPATVVESGPTKKDPAVQYGAQPERVNDRDILAEFYQGVRPYSSPDLGVYWRGAIELVDGSNLQVVVVEDSAKKKPTYSIVLRQAPEALSIVAEQLGEMEFGSARAALIKAERNSNRALYEQRLHSRDTKKSN